MRPAINHHIIRWAREWADIPLEELLQKEPRYLEWETGRVKPTLRQLEKLAKRLRTPLGFFFLPEPPEIQVPIADFRTGSRATKSPSPDLLAVLGQMQRRQEFMREYLLQEGADSLPFVGSLTTNNPVMEAAQSIRGWLDLAEDWTTVHKGLEDVFRFIRVRLESLRVMLVVMGYVGKNTRRTLNPEEFRGFVLSDPIAPLIFVNGADAKQAQLFTLAHELVHLWLDQDALLDLPKLQPADEATERYCDAVAAEFLVPTAHLRKHWPQGRHGLANTLAKLASHFKVSQIVIARRALDLQLIDKPTFFAFYAERQEAYELFKQRQKEKPGGHFWNTQGLRIDGLFGRAVVRAAREGRILYTDAYDMTSLGERSFDKLAEKFER